MTNSALLLETVKKLNSAYARKSYKSAYALHVIANTLRREMGVAEIRLHNLEARFEK